MFDPFPSGGEEEPAHFCLIPARTRAPEERREIPEPKFMEA
jgi:hypothetical protein